MKSLIPAILVLAAGAAAQAQVRGPSTAQGPYMLPSDPASGVVFYSIITNGNGTLTPSETYVNLRTGQGGYRMVGIPDGLGAFRTEQDIAEGTFTLTMNHELGGTSGIARAHGNAGSFVSRWRIRANPGQATNLEVLGGEDLADTAILGNGVTYNSSNPMPAGFNRFCSADLASPSAYRFGDLGTDARIHMTGEEAGAEGRAVAFIAGGPAKGTAYELPWLGKFSWENAVANPHPQVKTVVLGSEDSTPGNIFIYVGDKLSAGNDVERAGLTYGNLYTIHVDGTVVNGAGQAVEDRAWVLGNPTDGVSYSKPFSTINLGDVSAMTGAQLQAAGDAAGQMNMARPEDVAWDTQNPNRAFIATTDAFNGNSRLWSLTFTDIEHPDQGGTLTMLADGSNLAGSLAGGLVSATGLTDIRMMDNIGVTRSGDILIQEDVGNNVRLGRMWMYQTRKDRMIEIGVPDATKFISGAANFLTQDEETSGVIDARDVIGPGWALLDMQAHYTIAGELAEGGQVLAVYIPQLVRLCPADFNGDGFVDFLDMSAFIGCFEGQGCPAYEDADFDGDGFADFFDAAAYIGAFEAGC